MTSLLGKASVLALATTVSTLGIVVPAAMAQEHWMERIGNRWDVSEAEGWTGVWSRRSYPTVRSNIYDAVWTHPQHGTITAELRITLSVRNEITVLRTDKSGGPAGNRCTYKGWLMSNGVDAYGTHTCTWNPGATYNWTAKIRR